MLRRLALTALLAAAPIAQAHAAAVVLWPVDPTIATGQTATALWVENRGNQPVTLQVRSLGWSQAGNEDQYARQDEVVTSPPIANVAPGQRQMIRILRRDTGTTPAEHSYRLLIDELPPPQEASTAAGVSGGVNFRLRYSIPVFVPMAGAPAEPRLSWTLKQHDGAWFLGATNQGATHAQLSVVKLSGAGGASFEVSSGLMGYALAGSGREWRLPEKFPAALAATGLKVEATVNTLVQPAAAVAVGGAP